MPALTFKTLLGGALRRSFGVWERLGVHVTQNHFESPIPDTRTLNENLWERSSRLPGIELRETAQLGLLQMFVENYKVEYDRLPLHPTADPRQYHVFNPTFSSVDGEILYCMIRHFKPRRVFEVGSGNSTLLAAQALLKNQGETGMPAQLVAFEPFPNAVLRNGFPGLSRLVVSKVEDVPMSVFEELEANDILFLDSSHVLKIGGDVQYEFLEILPALRKGTVVHIHDIFLPREYPRRLIMKRRRFFSEQYLLQAFLAFNRSFEILWAGSWMHCAHPEILEMAFKSYDKNANWPGSFWIRRVN